MKIKLQRVEFMPKQLEAGTLYIAEEFGAAAHLCACGCGVKIRTPLGPTDWMLRETAKGVSLYPSITAALVAQCFEASNVGWIRGIVSGAVPVRYLP